MLYVFIYNVHIIHIYRYFDIHIYIYMVLVWSVFCGKIRVDTYIQLIPNMDPSVPRGSPWASSPRPRGRPSDLI